MTGKTEKVSAVVEELMDIHARDQRRGSLLDADKIDRDQEKEAAEDGPGHDFAGWDGDRAGMGSKNDIGHIEASWDYASRR
jgi:hypothetical protein